MKSRVTGSSGLVTTLTVLTNAFLTRLLYSKGLEADRTKFRLLSLDSLGILQMANKPASQRLSPGRRGES
jgi:hypothetical protein